SKSHFVIQIATFTDFETIQTFVVDSGIKLSFRIPPSADFKMKCKEISTHSERKKTTISIAKEERKKNKLQPLRILGYTL
ncbi:13585_t:CDS:1, partial [Dentiscutata erythropus]